MLFRSLALGAPPPLLGGGAAFGSSSWRFVCSPGRRRRGVGTDRPSPSVCQPRSRRIHEIPPGDLSGRGGRPLPEEQIPEHFQGAVVDVDSSVFWRFWTSGPYTRSSPCPSTRPAHKTSRAAYPPQGTLLSTQPGPYSRYLPLDACAPTPGAVPSNPGRSRTA